jgi:predicted dehydrogenase
MLERVLVVGLGSIGRRHARLIRQADPKVKIAALRRVGAQSEGEEWIDRVFQSVGDAILQFRPQAAIVANPATLHLETSMALARAGIHLMVEKPLAATQEGVAELISVCEAQQLVLATGYNLRFSPSLGAFKNQMSHVGRLISVRAEVGQYLPGWRPEVDYRYTVSASRALGGGALLELSHELDYLLWIFGDVSSICSKVGHQSELEVDVEDTAHVVMSLGAQPGEREVKIRLDLDLYRHDTTRTCVAIGTAGSLRWNGITGTVELFEPGAADWRQTFEHKPQRDETYLNQWEHFQECVRSGSRPVADGIAGLKVLRLIDAAREASDRLIPVTIN